MAKDKKTPDGLDLDDFDLDFDMEDMFGESPDAKNRTPVAKIAKGALNAFSPKEHGAGFIKKVLRGALPDAYGEAADLVSRGKYAFDTEADKIKKELKPGLTNLSTAAKKALPTNTDFLPKKIAAKVKAFKDSDSGSSSARSAGDTNYDPNGTEIKSTLQTIFGAERIDADIREKRADLKKRNKEKVDSLRFNVNASMFSSMDKGIRRLVGYQDTILNSYHRKSLELQYLQYFTMRDLLEVTKAGITANSTLLSNILKNTSLPEAAKIELNEQFKSEAQRRLIGKVQNSISAKISKLPQQMFSNLVKEGQNAARSFTDISGMVGMMSGGDDMMAEMGMDRNTMRGEQIGEGLRDSIGERLGKYGKKNLQSLLGKVSPTAYGKVMKFGSTLERGTKNYPKQLLRKLNNAEYGTSLYSLKEILGISNLDSESVTNNLREDPGSVASKDLLMHRSVVEIIPGYLSRSLEQLTNIANLMQGKGVVTDRVVYDTKRERFSSFDTVVEDTRKEIKDTFSSSAAQAAKNIINYIDPDGTRLGPTEQILLANEIARRAVSGEDFQPTDYVDNKNLPSDLSKKVSILMIRAFKIKRSRTKDLMSGKRAILGIDNQELMTKASTQFDNIPKGLGDYGDMLGGYNARGEKEYLDAAGLIDSRTGTVNKAFRFKIFEEMYRESILNETPASSNRSTTPSSVTPRMLTNQFVGPMRPLQSQLASELHTAVSNTALGQQVIQTSSGVTASGKNALIAAKVKVLEALGISPESITIEQIKKIKLEDVKTVLANQYGKITSTDFKALLAGKYGEMQNSRLAEALSVKLAWIKSSPVGLRLTGLAQSARSSAIGTQATARISDINQRITSVVDTVRDNSIDDLRAMARDEIVSRSTNIRDEVTNRTQGAREVASDMFERSTEAIRSLQLPERVQSLTDSTRESNIVMVSLLERIAIGVENIKTITPDGNIINNAPTNNGGKGGILKRITSPFTWTKGKLFNGIASSYRFSRSIQNAALGKAKRGIIKGFKVLANPATSLLWGGTKIIGASTVGMGRFMLSRAMGIPSRVLALGKGMATATKWAYGKAIAPVKAIAGAGLSLGALGAGGLIKGMFKVPGRLLKASGTLLRSPFRLAKMFGGNKENESGEESSFLDKIFKRKEDMVVRKLDDILSFLKRSMPTEDDETRTGNRAGGVLDIIRRRKQAQQNKGNKISTVAPVVASESKKQEGGSDVVSNALSTLGGAIVAKMGLKSIGSKVLSWLGKKLGLGALAAGVTGMFSTASVAGTAAAVTGAATSTAATAAAATATTSGIGALGGVTAGTIGAFLVSNPLGWAILAGTAAYAGYKGYQYYKKHKALSPLESIRFLQYGVNKTNDGAIASLRVFENEISPHIVISGKGRPTLDIDTQEIWEIAADAFDKEVSDFNAKNNFFNWFRNRFLPVMVKHEHVAKSFRVSLDGVDKLEPYFKMRYLSAITFTKKEMEAGINPLYSKDSPWDNTPLGTNEEDIQLVSAGIKDGIEKLNRDKSKLLPITEASKGSGQMATQEAKKALAVQTARSNQIRTMEELSRKESKESYFTEVYEKSKSLAKSAIANIKDGYTTIKSGAEKALSTGKEYISSGVDFVKNKIFNPVKDSLSGLIQRAESGNKGYNAYNRGTYRNRILGPIGDRDLTNMTIGQILADSERSPQDPKRLFAVGKYQMIPDTLREGIKLLRINPSAKFDAKMQEYLFAEYLLRKKKRSMGNFIIGKSTNSQAAARAAAEEWASIADPSTGMSRYGSGNKASVSSAQVIAALNKSKDLYSYYKGQGMSDAEAFQKAIAADGTGANLSMLSDSAPRLETISESNRGAYKESMPSAPLGKYSAASNYAGDADSGERPNERIPPLNPAVGKSYGSTSNPGLNGYNTGLPNKIPNVKSGNGVLLNKLHPEVYNRVTGLAAAYKKTTGKDLAISDAYRTPEMQAARYAAAKDKAYAAKQGFSLHQRGLALDVSRDVSPALLSQFGLYKPMMSPKPYEPWHIEPVETNGVRSEITRQGIVPNMKVMGSYVKGGVSSLVSNIGDMANPGLEDSMFTNKGGSTSMAAPMPVRAARSTSVDLDSSPMAAEGNVAANKKSNFDLSPLSDTYKDVGSKADKQRQAQIDEQKRTNDLLQNFIQLFSKHGMSMPSAVTQFVDNSKPTPKTVKPVINLAN